MAPRALRPQITWAVPLSASPASACRGPGGLFLRLPLPLVGESWALGGTSVAPSRPPAPP